MPANAPTNVDEKEVIEANQQFGAASFPHRERSIGSAELAGSRLLRSRVFRAFVIYNGSHSASQIE
jgi:hypothetical protein